jgi:hypothetical protein
VQFFNSSGAISGGLSQLSRWRTSSRAASAMALIRESSESEASVPGAKGTRMYRTSSRAYSAVYLQVGGPSPLPRSRERWNAARQKVIVRSRDGERGRVRKGPARSPSEQSIDRDSGRNYETRERGNRHSKLWSWLGMNPPFLGVAFSPVLSTTREDVGWRFSQVSKARPGALGAILTPSRKDKDAARMGHPAGQTITTPACHPAPSRQ